MVQTTGQHRPQGRLSAREIRTSSLRLFLPLLLAMGGAVSGCASETSSENSEDAITQGGGTVDRTFGKDGALRVKPITGQKETEVRIDPLGRFVQFAIERKGDNAWLHVEATNLRGERLPNYGSAVDPKGVPIDPWPGAPIAVDFLRDGSPVVLFGGLCAASSCPHDYDEPGVSKRYLVKLKPNGTLDTSFGKGGAVEFEPADSNSTDDAYGYKVAPIQDGSGVVVAIDRPKNTVQVRAVSLQGKTLSESTYTFAKSHSSQYTGPIVGLTKDTALLVRVRNGGDIPSSFDVAPTTAELSSLNLASGKMSRSPDEPVGVMDAKLAIARSLKIVGDSIYLMGHTNFSDHGGTIAGYAVTKFNKDLSLDRSFGTRGTASLKVGKQGWGGEAHDFSVFPNGKVVVVGTVSTSRKSEAAALDFVSNYDLAVARFNANGSPDSSFGENATQLVGAGTDREAYRAIYQAKNVTYLVGKADNDIVFSMLR